MTRRIIVDPINRENRLLKVQVAIESNKVIDAFNILAYYYSSNIRNFIHGYEFPQNHIRHFYAFVLVYYIKEMLKYSYRVHHITEDLGIRKGVLERSFDPCISCAAHIITSRNEEEFQII